MHQREYNVRGSSPLQDLVARFIGITAGTDNGEIVAGQEIGLELCNRHDEVGN